MHYLIVYKCHIDADNDEFRPVIWSDIWHSE